MKEKIKIKIRPKYLEGQDYWQSKTIGVILVEKEKDIEPLFKLLYAQDNYWKSHEHLIKVAPKEIDDISDITKMCEYVGKTDIYDIESLKKQIPFIIYQDNSVDYYGID